MDDVAKAGSIHITEPRATTYKDLVKLGNHIREQLSESLGELTEEIQKELNEFDVKMPAKIDGYCYFIEMCELESIHLKNKAEKLLNLSKTFEKAAEYKKQVIKEGMDDLGVQEIRGNNDMFKLQRSTPKTKIIDENLIPLEYRKTKVEVSFDKIKIKEDLKQGVPVPGAVLEESYFVKLVPNRKA